jgi:hypothetical protein
MEPDYGNRGLDLQTKLGKLNELSTIVWIWDGACG